MAIFLPALVVLGSAAAALLASGCAPSKDPDPEDPENNDPTATPASVANTPTGTPINDPSEAEPTPSPVQDTYIPPPDDGTSETSETPEPTSTGEENTPFADGKYHFPVYVYELLPEDDPRCLADQDVENPSRYPRSAIEYQVALNNTAFAPIDVSFYRPKITGGLSYRDGQIYTDNDSYISEICNNQLYTGKDAQGNSVPTSWDTIKQVLGSAYGTLFPDNLFQFAVVGPTMKNNGEASYNIGYLIKSGVFISTAMHEIGHWLAIWKHTDGSDADSPPTGDDPYSDTAPDPGPEKCEIDIRTCELKDPDLCVDKNGVKQKPPISNPMSRYDGMCRIPSFSAQQYEAMKGVLEYKRNTFLASHNYTLPAEDTTTVLDARVSQDGSSPFSSIQAAANAVSMGGLVEIEGGTREDPVIYDERVLLYSATQITIAPMTDEVAIIQGGIELFHPEDVVIEGGFRDWDPSCEDEEGNEARDNPSCYNLQITGGIRSGGEGAENDGGGFYIYGGSTVLEGLAVYDNVAESEGGGLFAQWGPRLEVTNSLFAGNDAGLAGGGMYILDPKDGEGKDTVVFEDLYLGDNMVEAGSGGGIYLRGSRGARLSNVTFDRNLAGSGGGLAVSRSKATVGNALFVDNGISTEVPSEDGKTSTVATSWGGAIALFSSSDRPSDPAELSLYDSVIEGCAALYGGGGIRLDGDSQVAARLDARDILHQGNTPPGSFLTVEDSTGVKIDYPESQLTTTFTCSTGSLCENLDEGTPAP